MSATPHVDHLVLRCADLERSRRFYEALGLLWVAEQHGSGARHYACTLGEVVLELYPSSGRPTSGARLGLRVPDVAAAVGALEALGGTVRVSGRAPELTAVVCDPDGNEIALTPSR